MQRAGLATARLALAIAPHAHTVWIAAGPGNNGGDGLDAALHLHQAGKRVCVVLLADTARLPVDAADALRRATAAGVRIEHDLPAVLEADLVIDALLGLGASRAPRGVIAQAMALINQAGLPVLAIDLPSGLDADTGTLHGDAAVHATHTLTLLCAKPGLFTAQGRDHAGTVWLDPLDVDNAGAVPRAWLGAIDALAAVRPARRHAQHKGSFGDVVVVGGASGMSGAALLAARAAAAAGAGRVFLSLLDPAAPGVDGLHPELMLRPRLWQTDLSLLARATVVCGCGGGSAVREALPSLLGLAPRLVLDADALNTIAADSGLQAQLAARAARGLATLLTPHPLEAARLLAVPSTEVQADRLAQAQTLAQRLRCVVLLKGSGSVIAAPGEVPVINPSGNARLASAGTGDVLAGWIGGLWAQAQARPAVPTAFVVAQAGAWQHGRAAQTGNLSGVLRASALIEALAAIDDAALCSA